MSVLALQRGRAEGRQSVRLIILFFKLIFIMAPQLTPSHVPSGFTTSNVQASSALVAT
jgi:hypothetical protein